MPKAEDIQWIFEHTRGLLKKGEIDWSIDDPCCWSFYLADRDEEKLVAAAECLHEMGYDIRGLLEFEDDNHDGEPGEETENPDRLDMIILQIDQVHTHTPETLMAECDQIKEITAPFEIAEFDGIEVGPEEISDDLDDYDEDDDDEDDFDDDD